VGQSAISPDRDGDKLSWFRLADRRPRRKLQIATTNPNNFEYTARPQLPVVGEALFASGWLLTIGLLNLFYAISVIAGSTIFITTAAWLVGDARPWGWLMLAVGLIQLIAAPGVLMGRSWALWVGLLSVAGHLAALIMFFAEEPGIAFALLVVDAVVLICLLVLVRSPRPATS
jgi:hypothetical protein